MPSMTIERVSSPTFGNHKVNGLNKKHVNGFPKAQVAHDGVNGVNGATKASVVELSDSRCSLTSPTAMPLAAGFLWNPRMMIHMTARGYATAQFMQPEPSKYTHAQILEAKHFMLPEQGTYAHHPGRFFFVKDRDSGRLFSAPYEPSRAPVDSFRFDVTPNQIDWDVSADGIRVQISLNLPVDDVCELWEVRVTNVGTTPRRISFYPAFPLGLISWMSQSAHFDKELNAIIADSTTAYQKVTDYFKNKDLKDQVFFVSEQTPQGFETRQPAFEGEGGLHKPDAITADHMEGGEAAYENPIAALQFNHDIASGQSYTHRFLFGPAHDNGEIRRLKDKYLSQSGFAAARSKYAKYIAEGKGAIRLQSPDPHFDHFVNTWLPRQVFYHGDTNRLSTDPQTRNFLQDAIGGVYVRPQTSRATLLKALSQQQSDGSLPDGILLYEGAELKYINTVPHTDHSVWLPLFLDAYLSETNDYAVLDETVTDHRRQTLTVRDRTDAAMRYLIGAVDHRNLHFISQGDWNDPMNMVGWRGFGVSGWLSLATAFALRLWARICAADKHDGSEFAKGADAINEACNKYLWDGDWYARGITDDNVKFGVSKDDEGRIYLNPQSFAIMGGAADKAKTERIIRAVEAQLEGNCGVEMLGPAYTHMREDVGRLTQKFPGVAENGSYYNHATAFYIYALFNAGYSDRAYAILRRTLPGPDPADYMLRGQLPIFVPNYYRGASRTHPRTAGRSSQLFNTGTAAWWYRCVVESLLGLEGCREGLRIRPRLPSHWPEARVTRYFRGATFEIYMCRGEEPRVLCNNETLDDDVISGIVAGKTYVVDVILPKA